RGRVEVVRALRAAFGGEDRVGLIHNAFAAAEAPDALLGRKVSRREYANQLKTSLISVNTDGLDGSPGFKIGESLAAGAAIVSQPLQFELPEPLLPDVHYLPFREPEECVSQCRRLLADPELAGRMRQANLGYYRRNVRPENHVRNLLNWGFE
ncbi:MAG: glycosyltransferase, partial [Gemmatimonadota bacterium]